MRLTVNREMSDPPVKLFWTGGWDSTYRLLDLVLVQGRQVQPYYLIDTHLRRSAGFEIRTMQTMRDELASDLIAPTVYRHIDDIAPNPSLTEKWARLRAKQYVGTQYDWFARFAAQEGLDGIEMGIVRGGGIAVGLLGEYVERDGDAKVLRSDVPADLEIFRPFRFPLFDLSKLDMRAAADRGGFRHLLERTWFCVTPTARGLPCGMCRPCRVARKAGMARRIPVRGHARYYRRRIRVRLRNAGRRETSRS
jgi:hypothetical protein